MQYPQVENGGRGGSGGGEEVKVPENGGMQKQQEVEGRR